MKNQTCEHIYLSSQKLYMKILISFTVIITITILALSSVLYFNLENISLSLIHSSIRSHLQQSTYSTRFMLSAIYRPDTHEAYVLHRIKPFGDTCRY